MTKDTDQLRRAVKGTVTFTFGPPRYFRPVCIRWSWGFLGGPRGYTPVPESRKDEGQIIVRQAMDAGVPLHKIEDDLDRRENQ